MQPERVRGRVKVVARDGQLSFWQVKLTWGRGAAFAVKVAIGSLAVIEKDPVIVSRVGVDGG